MFHSGHKVCNPHVTERGKMILTTALNAWWKGEQHMLRDANGPKKVWAFADSLVPLHPVRAFFGFFDL